MEKTSVDPYPSDITPLVSLVAALRKGCPWDKKQTARSMAVYLMEETHELVEAIQSGESDAICDELGDVLFHVLFIARLFQEQEKFDIGEVISRIHQKMVRRHPHVFGDSAVETADDVKRQWNEIKKKEKREVSVRSLLDSVPSGLPALMRAYRISERAAANGFDWDDLDGVLQKVEEEWGELKVELDSGSLTEQSARSTALELGDLLFTLTNVARFARIHPEMALADSILKFKKRFAFMERRLQGQGRALSDLPRQDKDALWEEAKQHYK